MAHLLLVAPSSDLSRSIEFALRAEGYDVISKPDVRSAAEGRTGSYDCAIVDHHALGRDREADAALFENAAPIILLANQAPHLLSPQAYRTLLKPFLGEALSDAVRGALGSAHATK